jgi:short-subunit dehydrogenase
VQVAERVFVVTGASSGLGREVARALTDAGGHVALVARRADRLEELAGQLGAVACAIPVDVTTAAAPDRIHDATVEAFGRIDGLVNAAGRGLAGDVVGVDLDLVDEAFELNFVAPLRLIQRILPTLIEQDEGIIVNVSSPTAVMGLPGIAGYASAKAALSAMTVALRREVAGKGVQVMLVYPGVMDTEYYDHIMGETEPDETRPPARSAALVARAIVDGILKNRREVWALTPRESRAIRLMRLLGAIAPGAVERGLSRR